MKNISTTTGLNKTSLTFTDLPPQTEGMAWRIVFALEALLIVAGNLLTIVAFAVNKNLHKKRLFLVANMALTDLLYGAVKMPFSIYFASIGKYGIWTGNLSSTVVDFLYNFITFFLVQGSLMCAAIICGEMFYAVHWPLRHRTLSNRVYRIVIFLTWFISFLVSIACTIIFGLASRKVAVGIIISSFFDSIMHCLWL